MRIILVSQKFGTAGPSGPACRRSRGCAAEPGGGLAARATGLNVPVLQYGKMVEIDHGNRFASPRRTHVSAWSVQET